MAGYDNKSETSSCVPVSCLQWNVIDSTFRPRVASGESPCCQRGPHSQSVLLDSAESVSRTRRVIPAYIAVERRYHGPIKTKQKHSGVTGKQGQILEDRFHRRTLPVEMELKISACRADQGTASAPGRARITTSVPASSPEMREKATAFIRRRTRFLVTAPPTFFATMKPKRAGAAVGLRLRYITV